MVTLNEEAFRNVMAESIVKSLPHDATVENLIAASGHQRHKVAKQYLDELYSSALDSPKNSPARQYFICKLMVMGHAAYADIDPLFSADKHELGNVRVTPHYSNKTRSTRFHPGITQEPLNIFVGLSTENTSGNQKIVDENLVFLEDNILKTANFSRESSLPPDLNVLSSQRNRSQHTDMTILGYATATGGSRSAPNSPRSPRTNPLSYGATTPAKTRDSGQIVSTPVSGASKALISPNPIRSVHVAGDALENLQEPKELNLAVSYVTKLDQDAKILTHAGDEHYRQLIVSYAELIGVNTDSTDHFNVLPLFRDCRLKWNDYRNELHRKIEDLHDKVKKCWRNF